MALEKGARGVLPKFIRGTVKKKGRLMDEIKSVNRQGLYDEGKKSKELVRISFIGGMIQSRE